ncbi:exonuclease SbcCD subunit D [Gracilibacillus sp. YIM 98692]|uniref:exonuclease SbcCD subunit D n=1 Tax=Gracilibacillus sp. YIM 98692 TaxID=2663532 RepID=UPI0013D290D9|nr:exonuclease SbcCD subunit D [Gracilibacillus sp. YIM 98692]
MKILHTADWHLGKLVHGLHMTDDQDFILQQLINIIMEESPDVVIIAGDLYDRAIPPKEAVELLNRTITTVCMDMQIPVLAISGNHDSPDRLSFGTSLFRSQQFYLATSIKQAFSPIKMRDEYGDIYFHLVPYLEPSDVQASFPDEKIESHQQAMQKVIDEISVQMDKETRHILIAHAFIAGGMESESEERLTMVGGTPYIDSSLFTYFDYVALGHLHRPQKIAKETLRYSGSILKYSFSEANHRKSITIIDMDEKGLCNVNQRNLIPKRDMKVVEGYFQDIIEEKVIERTDDYLQVELLDDGQLMDPVSKLRKLFPNILRLNRKQYRVHESLKELNQIRQKQEMTHEQLFEAFYREMKGEHIPEQRSEYVKECIQSLIKKEREL